MGVLHFKALIATLISYITAPLLFSEGILYLYYTLLDAIQLDCVTRPYIHLLITTSPFLVAQRGVAWCFALMDLSP